LYKFPARKWETNKFLFNVGEAYQKNFHGEDNLEDNVNQVKLQELPLFNLQELASATNNFHQSNKLGQGGFGPVYRVMVALFRGYCLTI
jgi:hypothetical protein